MPAPEASPSYGSPGWGLSPRGVLFRPSRRSRWRSAQLAYDRHLAWLAQGCRRGGFKKEREKKGAGPLPQCLCLRPPPSVLPAELNVRAEDTTSLCPPWGPSLPASLDSWAPLSFPRDLKHVSTTTTTQPVSNNDQAQGKRAETNKGLDLSSSTTISPTKYTQAGRPATDWADPSKLNCRGMTSCER